MDNDVQLWRESSRLQVDYDEWVKQQPSDVWHLATVFDDINENHDLLKWIIEQPDTDKSTVLDLFWRADPAYWLEECAKEKPLIWYQQQKIEILKEIAQKLCDGFYQHQELAFPSMMASLIRRRMLTQFEQYNKIEQRLRAEGKPLIWELPQDAFLCFDGREAQSNYFFENREVFLQYEVWKKRQKRGMLNHFGKIFRWA